jgi:hypothetical protein
MILFENCCYNFHQNGFLNISSIFKLNSNYKFDYKSTEILRYVNSLYSSVIYHQNINLLIEQFE